MSDIDDIDITIFNELKDFIDKVQRKNGKVLLSGIDGDMYVKLKQSGVVDKIGRKNIFKDEHEVFGATRNAIDEH